MASWQHRVWSGLRRAALLATAGTAVLVATFFALDALYPPNLDRYKTVSKEVRAADGSLLRLFPIEDGRLRRAVRTGDVDPLFIDMLVAYEDKRFFSHSGVDPLALIRAVWQAIASGEVISGASTLTMQTARLLEPRPRTLSAKITEMFRALQLERHYTKSQILQIYLTLAPYGGNLEGIKAASMAYFRHDGKHLTPDEAAMLVVLPQSPTALRPDRYPQRAKNARNKVLNRVGTSVGLDQHLVALAKAAPVPQTRHRQGMIAAHLAERLQRDSPRTKINTFIDSPLQHQIEGLAQKTARALHPNASVAILVAENQTRHVLAYVGSAGFTAKERAGFVDMVTAVRSPGSTLKPFIYGMAFDRGIAHPQTRILDAPRRFGAYAPSNFMDVFHGDVTVAEALRRSLNVPAVAVLNRLGPVRFSDHLQRAGAHLHLPGEKKAGLALALGGVGMSLEDLVMLYSALASDGKAVPLQLLSQPGQMQTDTPEYEDILSQQSRTALRQILSTIGAPGERLPTKYQRNPRRIAFKTGTSYGFRDAWAVGFDGGYTIGVWVGRPDGTPVPGHFGSNTAAPLLFDAFDILPLPKAPLEQATLATTAALPPKLKYFDRPKLSKATGKSVAPLSLAFPLADTVINLTGEQTAIMFSATGGDLPLQWFVDGKPLRTSRWSRTAATHLQHPGFYRVSVMDRNGTRVSANFSAETYQH